MGKTPLPRLLMKQVPISDVPFVIKDNLIDNFFYSMYNVCYSCNRFLTENNTDTTEISNIYMDSFEQAKKDFKGNIKEIILEFYGGYILAANRQMCRKSGLTDLIFATPLNEMPLYICADEYKKIIAEWRISINK